jgi:HlyD family secretion protein
MLDKIVNDEAAGTRRRRKRYLVVGALVVVFILVLAMMGKRGRASGPRFRTEELTRRDLTVTVSATGNLEPTNQVDVGSEVSGLVELVFVDDNDRVTTGQELARLDISRLSDDVANARAALAAAEARVEQALASVKEAEAKLKRQRHAFELSGGKVPSESELETAEATVARAIADESSARAQVEQARASLSTAETSLSKASIRSPINGVVLDRQIEPGQTVAASFQAPVLFTIAEDLSQMELEVDVDEADVGQVREGQNAEFTVDAYANRKYPATIRRVGLGSKTTDGVVFYTTVLTVSNDDLSLRPGMTATAGITTLQVNHALVVPNAALRFSPPVRANGSAPKQGIVSSLVPKPPGMSSKRSNGNGGSDGGDRVWILSGKGEPKPVPVTKGATDGRFTEVASPLLEVGMQVITEISGEWS